MTHKKTITLKKNYNLKNNNHIKEKTGGFTSTRLTHGQKMSTQNLTINNI